MRFIIIINYLLVNVESIENIFNSLITSSNNDDVPCEIPKKISPN